MPEKTIEKILEELYQQGLSHGRMYGYQDYSVPQASRTIRQLIKEELGKRLPEKRKLEKDSIYLQYDKGYNHAFEDCKTAIAEYLGEGKL